ncbi:DUF4422 domain-containing protein [Gaetbulibacter saemankumensis]|uniref:DUF4422 domain-containing protein n=1 Tax=Gaetbulibacter saemankumensis TaxID=311208 RepID=UPI000685931B|nr:DUF4422 domain-containing protein [Gaetbulibacter saemankumensis]
MKILIATHKDKTFINNNLMTPIQVGADCSQSVIDESYLLDNTGNNISLKNINYNELTSLYWMWKNMANENVVGLMHYRRYFHFFKKPFSRKSSRLKKIDSNSKLITKTQDKHDKIEEKITKWLSEYDIILPFPRTYTVQDAPATIAEDYCFHHRASDWNTAMEIIKTNYPEYKPSIEKYLYNSYDRFYMANMFIAQYDWLNDYCSWLFDILFKLESRITISEDSYQKRVFGFLSERLLSLYIHHNKFKVKHLPLLLVNDFFEDNPEITKPNEFIE